ncbi:MAG TPA: PAS domain S-box protein, partial [Dehalococcoidia bacterium]|nr:PAS domain S-box protein [Dehalococcoidia bacterium]
MSLQDQLQILKDGLAGADHQLQELFASSEVGACLIGRDGRFERLNPAWECCLGHPIGSMLGKAFLDFLHPDDREPTKAAMEKPGREATVRFQNRFRQSDGNYRTLQWVASRVGGSGAICAVVRATTGGAATGWVAGTSVADEVLDAAKLGASPAELYRSVVETSPDAIIVTDLNGTVLMCNQQAAIEQGVESPEQLLGLNGFEFVAPEHRELAIENARRTLEEGQVRAVEYNVLRLDGRRVPVELSASVIREPAGKPRAFIAVIRDISERKRTQRALLETKERYRSIVETSPDAIMLMNHERRIVVCNRQTAALHGYDGVEEMLGIDALEMVAPEDRDRALAEAQAAFKAGSLRNAHYTLIKKDGTTFPAEVSASAILDADGRPAGYTAVVRDITRRKQAQEAMRTSEERFRVLYQDNPSMYFTVDAGGRVLSVNAFGAEQLGYTAEELIGSPVLDVFFEADRGGVAEQLDACVENLGEVRHWEFRKVRKDGRVIWVKEAARATRDAVGETIVLIVCEDITEQKRTEEALRGSEERYRALYRDNPTMYFTVDAGGTVLSVNQFGAEQLGYEVEELLGKPVLDVFFDEDKSAVSEQLAVCVQRQGKVHHWEFRKVRKDGQIIWVEEAARATKDANGETIVLIVCEDITEQRRMEEELREAREALESKVEHQMERGRAYGL